jgi:endonuclease/exonuclease/phosphatase family metal-dependent hydrolase
MQEQVLARQNNNEQPWANILNSWAKSPKQKVIALILLGIAAGVAYVAKGCLKPQDAPTIVSGDGRPGTAFFCSWNVENFYDDEDDPKNDDDLEDWFGSDPAAFRAKVDHLAEALLKMNGGVGPDILACVEVENERCMNALRDAVNAKLNAAGLADRKYETILFKPDNTGRRFAPAIMTRFRAIEDRTKKPGNRSNGRILEGHLEVNGHELIIIAAHWTSRVTDKEDKGDRRLSYANDCYGQANRILQANSDADIVVCGDFNDEFTDVSMQQGLRASASADSVRDAVKEPKLLAVFANWQGDPPGTIYGKSKWSVFDHICLSRGLLDEQGWSCDPTTARIFAPNELRKTVGKRFEPFPFGRKNHTGPRGYSDHFPVTVQLKVAGSTPK